MSAKTIHYKVGNGDMTLMVLESGRRILIDCKIGLAADDPNENVPDVGTQLRNRLAPRDPEGRFFVDAFLLTHPDQDHCAGLRRHFHLGTPGSWVKAEDKVIIREMWSSPIVFRRADRKTAAAGQTLCADAEAWRDEARRWVRLFRAQGWLADGDRIKILGEDVDGKTDDLIPILVSAGSIFSTICGVTDGTFTGLLLAPMLADDDEKIEVLSKNNSSVIVRLTLAAGGNPTAGRFLFGGDAEVAIWERIRNRYKDEDLTYDVLMAPHHCSWHSLSWDSWSKMREKVKVSERTRSALAQAASGAIIVSSSNSILDDDCDPPCIRAKREYEVIFTHPDAAACSAGNATSAPAGTRPSPPKPGRGTVISTPHQSARIAHDFGCKLNRERVSQPSRLAPHSRGQTSRFNDFREVHTASSCRLQHFPKAGLQRARRRHRSPVRSWMPRPLGASTHRSAT